MIAAAVSKKVNYPLSEEQCLWHLQNKANIMGCCFVEVLPVEKTSALTTLYGNKVANEKEQWLARVLVMPKKWYAPDSFWRSRVKNDLTTETSFHEGENLVYSEFCGRDIVKISAEMQFIREDKNNLTYSSEAMLFNTEPLIDIPFGVGSILVCQPAVLKKHDEGSHGGVMVKTTMPVNISIEEILGYMNGNEFVPFLHIIVEKIKETFLLGNDDLKMEGKHYKPYLKYVRGATFLPLEKGCFVATKYGNEMIKQDARHPESVKFIYKGTFHNYRVVYENEDILAYTVNGEWTCCPNVVWGKSVDLKEVVKYLYDHETPIIFEQKVKKLFKMDGIDGYVVFGAYYDIKTNKGEMVFCLERHLIGRIAKGENGIDIAMAADKVAFDIDLRVHYGDFIPPGETEVKGVGMVNVVQCYEMGANVLKIDTVLAKNGDGLYFYEHPSYGFFSAGWTINGKPPFSFWFTQKDRVAAIIKNMETIQVKSNRVMVKLLQKEKTESGILLGGKDAITDLAEVIEVGEAVNDKDIVVGCTVSYNKLALSSPITWKGETCYFIREPEITAIIS